MYLSSREFAEDRIPWGCTDAMRDIAFGRALVTHTGAEGLAASHIPLLIDARA